MTDIYAERIETASYMIELYLEKELPNIPDAITNNRERCTVINARNCLKEAQEEISIQSAEIKAARNAYTLMVQSLHGEEKKEQVQMYKDRIVPGDLQSFLR